MILINKLPEPNELVTERCNHVQYEVISKNTKTKLYNQLLKEQHYLCAYCTQRIELSESHTSKNYITIDHFKSQSKNPELSMNYENMLGSCSDCQNNKGNQEIYVNPLNKSDISKIKYSYNTGKIFSNDSGVNNSLSLLKLDSKYINNNRKRVLADFRARVAKKYLNKTLACENWQKEKQQILNMEKYPPFAGILFSYIDDKIKK